MLKNIILLITIVELCHCERGYFTITEESKIGTELYDASKLLRNKIKPTSKFAIIDNSNFRKYIHIQEQSGRTTIIDRIDRELICIDNNKVDPFGNKCSKSLRIIIINNNNKEILDLEFEILDINDNAPIWPSSIIKLQYPESSKKGSIKLPLADDKDSGQNALIKYQLQTNNPDNAYFNFENGENRILLTPKYEIDYETTKFYNLTLIAEDKGIPSLSSILHIEVNVIDVNDNSPRFSQKIYRPSKSIYETINIDTTIIKVEAKDKDSDQNSKITYYIDPSMPKSVKDQFYIDSLSGEIKLKNKLDYDRGFKSFSFIVIAKDNAPAPYELSSSATVEINVVDVNDEIPIINIFFSNSQSAKSYNDMLNINLPENLNPQYHEIAHVNVEDADEDDKTFIHCLIDNKENFKLIPDNIKQKSFTLSATKSFDREKIDTVRVRIICQDSGKNENIKEIMIHIIDENDNEPQFDNSFEFFINENGSQINKYIGKIFAIDNDFGKNKEIEYRISSVNPGHGTMFNLDSKSGKLYASKTLDREAYDHHNITVIASDKGIPSLSGTGSIIVRVLDINDWPPMFESLDYKFTISEEVLNNTMVGRVKATDKDIGQNSLIKYYFIADSFNSYYRRVDSIEKFVINSSTGIIRTKGSLDRETRSSYLLIVEAMNPDVQGCCSISATVQITVTDYNDNAPKFYSPANGSSITIDTDRSIETEIIQLRATDIDEDKNGNIVYTIVSSTDHQMFNLASSSGTLYLLKKIESYKTFQMSVRACDTGVPPKCSDNLIIFITATKPTFVDTDNPDFTVHKNGITESNGAIIACLVVIFVILVMAMVIMFFLIRNKQILWKRRLDTNYDKSSNLHGRNMDSYFNKKDTGSIYEADLLLLNERNKANNVMLNSMYSPKMYAESQMNCKPDSPCYRTIDAMVSSVYNPLSQMVNEIDRSQTNCNSEIKSNFDIYPQHHHFRGASEPSYRYSNLSGRSTLTPVYPIQHSYYQSVSPSGTSTIRLKNNFNNTKECFNIDNKPEYNSQTMPRSISLMKCYEKQNEKLENSPDKCQKYRSENRPKYAYEAFREGSFI